MAKLKLKKLNKTKTGIKTVETVEINLFTFWEKESEILQFDKNALVCKIVAFFLLAEMQRRDVKNLVYGKEQWRLL